MKWWSKAVFENYANFSGRARRKEYWGFTLMNMVFSILIWILFGLVAFIYLIVAQPEVQDDQAPAGLVAIFGITILLVVVYALAMMIPGLAVTVRRLHDIGKSGWFYFIAFIPFIGGIILFVWLLLDGQPGPNKWGASPKFAGGYDSFGNPLSQQGTPSGFQPAAPMSFQHQPKAPNPDKPFNPYKK